jgi:uncharacterized membrane protein
MADGQGNARQKNFDGLYFWGMIIAMFVSLAIFVVLAFTSQVHIGHGQAQSRITPHESQWASTSSKCA